jgi:glyoxylase-like metal-dependent hydrolase (beta-lactamase superfamily II)
VCVKTGSLLLSGDTLFAGSCGRTDFPGGSMADMRRSLAALAKLPPETEVVPGHGPSTTIAREVASNPFMER